jgi:hypothetical protein
MLFDPPQHALDPVCSSFHLMFLSAVRQGCRRRIATPRALPPYHLSASLLIALGCSRWSSARVRPTSTIRSPGGRRARGPRAGSAPRGCRSSGSSECTAFRHRRTRQAEKGYCRRPRPSASGGSKLMAMTFSSPPTPDALRSVRVLVETVPALGTEPPLIDVLV